MPSTSKLAFLPRLEALRGIAAVSVVGYHVVGQFVETSVTGMAPVVMFFVLSGFVLARSLANDPNPVSFLRHRLFRLFPAAAAVVLLLHFQFGFFVGYEARFDPLNVLLNALMIRHDINGVMWSMTVECVATPLILVSAWGFQRSGFYPLAALIVVLFGLSFVGPYVHLLGGFTNLAPLYAFVVGVLLHFRGQLIAEKVTPFTPLSSGAIVATTALAVAITTPIAWASWRFVEMPFIALRKRLDADRRKPMDLTNPTGAMIAAPD